MFHLFNRVYLEHIRALDLHQNRIVVSKEHGHALSDALEPYYQSKLAYFSSKTDRFYKDEFLKLLPTLHLNNNKLIIYCDENVYKQLIVVWLMAIMPQLQKETLQKILYAQGIHQYSMEVRSANGVTPGDALSIVTGDEIDQIRSMCGKDDTLKNIRKFIASIWKDVSLEYRVGSYLSTGKKDALVETIKLFVNRYFYNTVHEYRHHLLQGVFSQRQMQLANYTLADLETATDPLSVMKGFDALLNPSLCETKGSLEHLNDARLSLLKGDLIKFSKEYLNLNDKNICHTFKTLHIVNKPLEAITDEDVDLFLDTIRESYDDDSIISGSDRGNVNTVVLRLFLNTDKEAMKFIPFVS